MNGKENTLLPWKVFRDDNASVQTEEMAEEGDLPF